MTKKKAIERIKAGLFDYKVAALLRNGNHFSYCTMRECVEYQQRYNPDKVVQVFEYKPNTAPATHFIAVYSVNALSLKTREIRKDYCVTEPRENRFLIPFVRSAGEEMVAIFKIKYRNEKDN